MDFCPEFLASSWGRDFLAGGIGGITGIVAGYLLDTIRIWQQHSKKGGSAATIFRHVVSKEGPLALYRGMAAPLASVTFQNAMVFQIYAILSRAFDNDVSVTDPPSYKGVYLGGVGTGAMQSLLLSPVELVKIRVQLQRNISANKYTDIHRGPVDLARSILKTEGLSGMYRGLMITVLRDAPAHEVYFWTYEYMREQLHPGCRKNGQESFRTMLFAGGLASVATWISCYPSDVIKTRFQAQNSAKYTGIVNCFRRSVKEEGYRVLWRGLGTAVARAFVVNGAIFTAYETTLRCFYTNNSPANHANRKCNVEKEARSIIMALIRKCSILWIALD
ncbi:OLC1v1021051C1 [Oldenlandia corymbosa var. corymbosa]|uniref:OLC1v1021051C1 n=1 Tax=Oldenlandia corymbosa var. corymbosa TaxID=529605 RepID=A0AAV1BZB8_OLDCO|nr:OLC1v1021051C1 [Oldenlandia corymbosa var. corymbosa]